MFRSLMAALTALTVGFAAAPDQAKADETDLAVGLVFGAILGGTLAVLADGSDNDKYRSDRHHDRRVYHSPPPRYYGHRTPGRQVYYGSDRYRHDHRKVYDGRRYQDDRR